MVNLGRIGAWVHSRQWANDPAPRQAAAELEELGFGAVWIGQASGDLDLPETLLDATETIAVATGVVNLWGSPAAVVASSHSRVSKRFPGRFLLGLGSGHAYSAELAGQRYERPLSTLASYLDELDAAATPVPRGERVLAALGPRAIQLSGERSAGAHPYLVTPEHTATARGLLGSDPLLAPEQKVLLGADTSDARAAARRMLAPYLELPNYLNNLRRLGFGDADFADGGSNHLVDELVAWGDETEVAARVQAHFDAGADHVVVQVLSTGNPGAIPRHEMREAANLLIG
jgi:probable F420-dependent oxidoreductase